VEVERVVQLGTVGRDDAAGSGAVPVALAHVLREGCAGSVAGAPDVEHGAGDRVGEDPPPDAVRGQLPGLCGADGAVPGQIGGCVVLPDEGAERNGDGDVHRHVRAPGGAAVLAPAAAPREGGSGVGGSRDEVTEPVGAELLGRARVAVGAGGASALLQHGVDLHAVGGAQDDPEAGHPVREHLGPGHPAAGSGPLVTFGAPAGVDLDEGAFHVLADLGGGAPGGVREDEVLHGRGDVLGLVVQPLDEDLGASGVDLPAGDGPARGSEGAAVRVAGAHEGVHLVAGCLEPPRERGRCLVLARHHLASRCLLRWRLQVRVLGERGGALGHPGVGPCGEAGAGGDVLDPRVRVRTAGVELGEQLGERGSGAGRDEPRARAGSGGVLGHVAP